MNEQEATETLERLFSDSTNEDYPFTECFANALAVAIQALEKQIPKKPVKSEKQVVRYVNTYYCPICNLGITGTNIAKWCYHCGQKLDWSDND